MRMAEFMPTKSAGKRDELQRYHSTRIQHAAGGRRTECSVCASVRDDVRVNDGGVSACAECWLVLLGEDAPPPATSDVLQTAVAHSVSPEVADGAAQRLQDNVSRRQVSYPSERLDRDGADASAAESSQSAKGRGRGRGGRGTPKKKNPQIEAAKSASRAGYDDTISILRQTNSAAPVGLAHSQSATTHTQGATASELEAAVSRQGAMIRQLKEEHGLGNSDRQVAAAVAELKRLKAALAEAVAGMSATVSPRTSAERPLPRSHGSLSAHSNSWEQSQAAWSTRTEPRHVLAKLKKVSHFRSRPCTCAYICVKPHTCTHR